MNNQKEFNHLEIHNKGMHTKRLGSFPTGFIRRRGFTLIELLVVIAIIALLMSILMPAIQRVKKQANAVACLSRLRQWGLIFSMYTTDNNGYFHTREFGTQAGYEKMWPELFLPYYKDPMMRCCPAAKNPNNNWGPFGTWGTKGGPADTDWGWGGTWVPKAGIFGSYAMSRYVLNKTEAQYWRKTDVKGADKIPVFLDCMYLALWGFMDAMPPEFDGDYSGGYTQQCACISRHCGTYINVLFMDWSVRKVGLKELWTLKWSKIYEESESEWTIAGNGGGAAGKNACRTKWNTQSGWLKKLPVY